MSCPRTRRRKRTPEQLAALVAKGIAASETHVEAAPKDGHNWPPIINLSEAGGYFFATRSAELRPDFESILETAVVDRLLEIAASFQVDVIEVIGHTDERPVSGGVSNLDRELGSVMSGAHGVGVLQPADNAGLGLARALAVVKVLSSEPSPAEFPHPAAVGRPAYRNGWAAHARRRAGRRPGAPPHRDQDAEVRRV